MRIRHISNIACEAGSLLSISSTLVRKFITHSGVLLSVTPIQPGASYFFSRQSVTREALQVINLLSCRYHSFVHRMSQCHLFKFSNSFSRVILLLFRRRGVRRGVCFLSRVPATIESNSQC